MQQIDIDRNNPKPIFRQIADYLRRDILSESGRFRDNNGKLPPEDEVAQAFQTARVTLRKALKILEDEGLIVRTPGKGTFVTSRTKHEAVETKRIGLLDFMSPLAEMTFHRAALLNGIEHGLVSQFPTESILLRAANEDEAYSRRLAEIRDMDLDGVFIIANLTQTARLVHSDIRSRPHVVLCNGNPMLEKAGFNVVDVDNRKGMSLLVEHLCSLGHSRIAFMTRYPINRYDTQIRHEAFLQAVAKAGLDPDACPVLLGKQMNLEDVVEHVIDGSVDVTAIVTPGYFHSADVIYTLQSNGVRVPDDISVVGFDYFADADKFIRPQITTIRTPTFELGMKAGEMMCNQILNRPLRARREILDVELVVQSTTSAPRGSYRGRSDDSDL